MCIRPGVLIPTPQQPSNKEDETTYTQKPTHKVNLRDCFSARKAHRVDAWRWEIVEQHHQETQKVPHRTNQSTPPPRTMIRNQLSPQHTRRKRQNRKHQHAHILPSLRRRRQLRRRSQRRQLVDAGACTRERHAGDKDVHGLRGGAHDAADDGEEGAADGAPAPPEEVGERADEGADGCEGDEVGLHEPNPAVGAADVAVDVGWDGACQVLDGWISRDDEGRTEEVDGDLGADPEEGHGYEGHDSAKGHRRLMVVILQSH